jgi:TATA-binding protein-associated factor Taf7
MSRIFENQNQFVIRFPEHLAEQINAYFEDPDNNDMPEIELDMDRERRDHSNRIALKVGLNGEEYKATVMELPTISSTFKTIDRVNFFKSNDVSEMIVVHESEDAAELIYQDMAEKVKDREDSTH